MRLMDQLRNSMLLVVAGITLALSSVASAENIVEEHPSAGAMVADAIVARPLYFALSQIGSAVYGITLPFTLLGGNADQAAETLVVTPLQAGFIRCLGCGHVDSKVSELSELDGTKYVRHFLAVNAGITTISASKARGDAFNYGLQIGTHFSLSDKSRYDVILAARHLDIIDIKDGVNEYKDEASSYQLMSRFGLDLGFTDLMFKIGMHYWTVERQTVSGTPDHVSKDGFNFLYGVGLDFWLSDMVRLGIDYTRLEIPTKAFGYDLNTSSYNATLSVLFF